jgi:TPP-dependent pyruvate/acetoin dehydrogenase alpha subunit
MRATGEIDDAAVAAIEADVAAEIDDAFAYARAAAFPAPDRLLVDEYAG